MKKTIDGKVYNTDTAALIAEDGNGRGFTDFHYWRETLYQTKKGNWFLHGQGGAFSDYGVSNGNNSYTGSENIILMSREEAFEWCQKHDAQKAIDAHFADMITEG